ncbi:MFS transporter [Pantoea sp. Nvir]|uniref:hypothetical protein n=1 Tax=Pantoea sp. Nvir TaxID=2576760 RepID=UPI00135AC9AC|nr:hypothetical protein [Pantoea sp. Nvir]MXP66546.1 MFS transporter [Pantoea sp. Nvir]
MHQTRVDNSTTETIAETYAGLAVRRISWSAIFAGVISVLIVHILLTLLGTAIGAATVDPQQEQNPLQHLGTGALIWTGLSMLISMAVGSYLAGCLAQRQGALHGLLMFGVSTLLTIWLTVSLASNLIGGAFNIIGTGFQAIGSSISTAVPMVTNYAKQKLYDNNINLDNLQHELTTMLHQTGTSELQQENVQQSIGNEKNNKENNSKNADNDITSWVRGVLNLHSDTLQVVNRDALKNIIKAHTSKSDQEVEKIVNQTEQSYQQAVQQYRQLKQQAEQKAREAAQQAAEVTAKASWYIFFMLLIEAVLAAVMGRIGLRTQYCVSFLSHERR